ncbi:MAG: DUF4832 domain-containing protein [Clostridia bacterium]|nr:DUF4832 domain-containing protein [Clostridia bacterium]
MFYHDYRPLQDDKTVLSNPHKGWYYHYIDNGLTRPTYRDGATKEELLSIPGLRHLYLRFDWSDIEKEEGHFDWSPLEQIMEEFSDTGLTFSLRLCTYEAGKVCAEYATPRWVAEQCGGVKVPKKTGGFSFEPDYGNPYFLEQLERFMEEYGRQYNGDPRIETVDIGTFGTWGEGHTSSGSCKKYNPEVLLKHINLHLKYFPDTQLLVNDDMLRHPDDPAALAMLTEYCAGHGIGIRDDGVCVGYYAKTFGYDTLCNHQIYQAFTPFAPCDLELEHYHMVKEDVLKDGLPFLEAMKTAKATYAGFHGYPQPWMSKHRYLTEYCANRLGYWYFINGLQLAQPVSGTIQPALLELENRGFAKGYHPYTLKLTAKNETGQSYLLNPCSPDSRDWEGTVSQRLQLDFRKVPPGSYRLCVGLYDQDRLVRLALRDDLLESDGSYCLESVTVASL